MRSYNITPTDRSIFWARVARLTRQDGIVLRVAEAERALTVGGETFTPLPGCSIGAVKHIINGEMPSTQIDFAHKLGGVIDTRELARGFWDAATVQIYIIDRRNITTLGDVHFTGSIQPVTIDLAGKTGSFDCRGLAVQNETIIQKYQPMCRTDLFSVLCGLDKTALAKTCTVATITDLFNITVTMASPPADGDFQNGTGISDEGFKFQIADDTISSNGKLKFYQAITDVRFTVGQTLTLYPGCKKTPTWCRTRFNNKLDFQGEDHFLGVKGIVGL